MSPHDSSAPTFPHDFILLWGSEVSGGDLTQVHFLERIQHQSGKCFLSLRQKAEDNRSFLSDVKVPFREVGDSWVPSNKAAFRPRVCDPWGFYFTFLWDLDVLRSFCGPRQRSESTGSLSCLLLRLSPPSAVIFLLSLRVAYPLGSPKILLCDSLEDKECVAQGVCLSISCSFLLFHQCLVPKAEELGASPANS